MWVWFRGGTQGEIWGGGGGSVLGEKNENEVIGLIGEVGEKD